MKRKTKPKKFYKPVEKRWVDPDKFVLYRMICGMDREQCAEFLNVSRRTVQAWENRENPIPYHVFKFMRIHANGGLLAEKWKGWTVRDDYICSPDGRTWKQYELYYIANYISMARFWLRDQERKSDARRAALERRLNSKFKVVDGGKKW